MSNTPSSINQRQSKKQFTVALGTSSAIAKNWEVLPHTKMVLLVKQTFKDQIEAAPWMEQKTKEAAFLKLKLMTQGVGYPDKYFGEEDIDKRYEKVSVNKSNFYQTRLDLANRLAVRDLMKLKETLNNNDWQRDAKRVNAFCRYDANAINLLAGLLQPPFFSAAFPRAIGNVIGHELSHAFDLHGSQYDEKGNLRNWWTPDDLKKFKKKTQCLVNQYSKYYIKQVGLYINGKLSVQENAGDTGGYISAYKAYKKSAATQPKELPLPGLGLTTDQQVFVGMAQVRCAKYKTAYLRDIVISASHPPGPIRIKGPLQNNEDFAKAFNCPVGSPMNPEKKCVVW